MRIFYFILFTGFCLLGSYAEAQKMTPEQLPKAVLNKFNAFYPEVKKAKWEKEGKYYEAMFKQNKMKMEVVIDSMGNIYQMEYIIKKAELPKTIADTIAKSFPGFRIEDVEKIDMNGIIKYKAGIEKGKEEWLVIYNESGKLLSKEAEEEEKKPADTKKPEKKKK